MADRYLEWSRAIRIGAGALVVLFGIFKLIERRHPRALARIRPTRLAWWSFLMATAHGAGLMLLPFMLGLCVTAPAAADATGAAGRLELAHATLMDYLARSNVAVAVSVAGVHTLAMMRRPRDGLGRVSLPRAAFPAPCLAQPRRSMGREPDHRWRRGCGYGDVRERSQARAEHGRGSNSHGCLEMLNGATGARRDAKTRLTRGARRSWLPAASTLWSAMRVVDWPPRRRSTGRRGSEAAVEQRRFTANSCHARKSPFSAMSVSPGPRPCSH